MELDVIFDAVDALHDSSLMPPLRDSGYGLPEEIDGELVAYDRRQQWRESRTRRSAAAFERGRLLRHAKCSRKDETCGKVIKTQVKHHNKVHAMRPGDVIDLEALGEKRRRVRGRGAYRLYVAQAVQRVCWGRQWQVTKMDLRHFKRQRHGAQPLVMSARSYAGQAYTTHSYVQKVRDASAAHFCNLRDAALARISPESHHTIMQVSFDETELDLTLAGADPQTRHVMLLHSKFLTRSAAGVRIEDVPCAPAVIEDTRAATLRAAVEARVPGILWSGGPDIKGIVLNSDSAAPCKAYGKAVERMAREEPTTYVLHPLCMMHMFWAGIHRLLETGALCAPLFCCSTLAHKARYMSTVEKYLEKAVRARLRCVFTPPPAAGQAATVVFYFERLL